ncbi:MBL fold metallo-hydrolase [Candidatus Micrarchaeota archaeon]|nr:MBL fold metallo-hydrolase [Candidatus Micrarchaeota archaeon]
MKITIVYDNEAEGGLEKDWGFSCFIEAEKNILFDCGTDGGMLLRNMKKLGIDPGSIDSVIISHTHLDHIGGLNKLLEKTKKIRLYLPEDFEIKSEKCEITVVKEKEEICREISAKVLSDGIREEYIMIKTKKGLVVITGCAHPGLENIIDDAKKYGKIYAIIGGFHGFGRLEKLKEIEMVIPCHCTSQKKDILKMDNSGECSAGKIFEFD